MKSRVEMIRGYYRDILIKPDGQIAHDSGWSKNTIVTNCRILLASFIKGETTAGIVHLQVGQGDSAWDASGAPPSPVNTEALVTPYDPPILAGDLVIKYLDDSDNVIETAVTPRIEITASLGEDYPAPLPGIQSYPLREFGLFGQLDGTPFMINSIRHPVIHKDADATLVRKIRLYF